MPKDATDDVCGHSGGSKPRRGRAAEVVRRAGFDTRSGAGFVKVGYALGLPGDQYITLANQTGGSSGSICNENVSEVIEEIVIGALGASSRSMLDKRPVSGSLSVRSDMRAISRTRSNGFDYEPGNNSVLFFGSAAPKVGAPYDAAYAFFQYLQ